MSFFSKRSIKNVLAQASLRWAGTNSKRSYVLTYHKIVPDRENISNLWAYQSCAEFEEQIEFLRERGFKFISLEQFLIHMKEGRFPERSILLTLDDGAADNYTYAYPILRKHKVPAVIFLVAGYIGTNKIFWWDRLESWINQNVKKVPEKILFFAKIERLVKNGGFDLGKFLGDFVPPMERSALNWQEIEEMQAGGISFGAHTVNHVDLGQIPDDQAFQELAQSKKILEEKLTARIKVFAFPYGEKHNFSVRHFAMLRQLDFAAAFSTVPGAMDPVENPFCLKRISVSGSDDFWVFKAKLTSAYPKFAEALKRMEKYVPLPF